MPALLPTTDTFAEALIYMKVNGWATVQQIATWTGVNPSTVYDWLNGTTSPNIEAARGIVQNAGDKRVKLIIAGWLLGGSGISYGVCADKPVGADQVSMLEGCIVAVREAVNFAEQVKEGMRDRVITAEEMTRIRADADRVKCDVDRVVGAAAEVHERSIKTNSGLRIAGA